MSAAACQCHHQNELLPLLSAYHGGTGLPLRLIDEGGRCLLTLGRDAEFCTELSLCRPGEESCQQLWARAYEKSLTDMGCSIFACCGGLHFALLALPLDKTAAAVLAGPFLLAEADQEAVLSLDKSYTFDKETLLKLVSYQRQIPILAPAQAQQAAALLFFLLSSASSGEELRARPGRPPAASHFMPPVAPGQERRSSEKYPLEKEAELLALIKAGDGAGARAALDQLLGLLLLYGQSRPDHIKLRLAELCALLSRAAIARGSESEPLLAAESELLTAILESGDALGACRLLQENAALFMDGAYPSAGKSNRSIRRAMAYVAAHYGEAITLEEVAEHIHLNPSYLSALFKRVTKANFREYLNRIRINEARRLLTDTDGAIVDIAASCGFNDQSYFTKVFKKATGQTPKQYRGTGIDLS